MGKKMRNTFVMIFLALCAMMLGGCESENKHFYLLKLDAGKNYTFETESEFSNNSISLNTESGKTYYIYHYLRMGLLFSQSDFELVTDPDDIEDAQVLIKKSEMSLPHTL